MQYKHSIMYKKSTFYLMIILMFILQSCVSYDNTMTNPRILSNENLNELNGRYGIVAVKIDGDSFSRINDNWTEDNFFTENNRGYLKRNMQLDSLKSYSFELKILSSKSLQISYIEDDKILCERIIKTKLKKDGYLYLRNKNVLPILIPFILGGMDVKRTRISKFENGDVVLDVANHQSFGFILLSSYYDSMTYKYRLQYKKID